MFSVNTNSKVISYLCIVITENVKKKNMSFSSSFLSELLPSPISMCCGLYSIGMIAMEYKPVGKAF